MKSAKRIQLVVGASGALLLSLAPILQAGTSPLYQPEPIQVPCAMSADKMRGVIRNGVLKRGWIPKETGAGLMEARLDKRTHVAIVSIHHDAKAVKISYKSSENLNYEAKGKEATIHSNYNNWIKNIEKDIALGLSRACT